jgi:alpha-D-ribose 1-methylphosphonate 5-triphosphate diphosphatase
VISLGAARVVTATGEPGDGAPVWVSIDGPRIVAVGREPPVGGDRVDLGDAQLWPGIVDLHADSLGRFESPRPGTRIPLDVAIRDFAVDAAGHGVTRPHLCIVVGEGPDPTDSLHRAQRIAATLDRLSPHLPVPVALHLRVDIGSDRCLDHARTLLDEHPDRITLVSAMDHTPGRGQYHDVDAWRTAMRTRTGADDTALDRWLAWLPRDYTVVARRRMAVADLARGYRRVFASHDDESAAAARGAAAAGATISEFPLTAAAAHAARGAGLAVVMGAPNAWRGRSHLTGLSARDALRYGDLDVLASDYHSGSFVHAVLALVREGLLPLPEAVALVTSRPAQLIGLAPSAGRLAPGTAADLVAITTTPTAAAVTTWVSGRIVAAPTGLRHHDHDGQPHRPDPFR